MAERFGRVDALNVTTHKLAAKLGNLLVEGFHNLALFAIGATIVWSAVFEFVGMMQRGRATIEDILLLFIFLELGAMVGIYFKTNHMPVRFLIYVAITALTRVLIGEVGVEHETDIRILIVTGGILLLAFAVVVLRYASYKYPAVAHSDEGPDKPEAVKSG